MALTDKAREKRNEYQRNYRKKNKGKIKEQNESYWEKKAQENNEEELVNEN